jgi:hypothetical protein
MPISFRRLVVTATSLLAPLILLGSFSSPQAAAQTSTHPGLQRQLDRIDLGLSAAGEFGSTVSGVEKRDASTTKSVLTIRPSQTIGELVTIRYTARPYFGLEFNFANHRFVQNYTFTPPPSPTILTGGAQANVREYTFGYVAHPGFHPLGVDPFLGAGAGTLKFQPTTYGGQGLPYQYRAVYYWQVGAEKNFPDSHFGMRAAFKQNIYLTPDFLQNYLTILKRVKTSEPTIGFFVRF